MKRKCYYSYDYIDPDDLYTYPGSSVLRNKQEERDEQKACELEYHMVASQSLKLFINPILEKLKSDNSLINFWFFKRYFVHYIFSIEYHLSQIEHCIQNNEKRIKMVRSVFMLP